MKTERMLKCGGVRRLVADLALVLSGCDTAGEGPAEVETTTGAVVGTNPLYDASFLFETTKNTYRDIAVSSTSIYLVKTAGGIEVRPISAPTTIEKNITGSFRAADFVGPEDGGVGLVTSSDTSREIWIHAEQTTPDAKIRYPIDVSSTQALAAIYDGAKLEIWVRFSPPSGVTAVRKLSYNPVTKTGLWGATLCTMPPSSGLGARGNLLMTFSTSPDGRFAAVNPIAGGACGIKREKFAASSLQGLEFTEHAYLNSARSNTGDTLAAQDLDYEPASDRFYALDRFVSGTTETQVVVRLPASHVVFSCTADADCGTGYSCSSQGWCRKTPPACGAPRSGPISGVTMSSTCSGYGEGSSFRGYWTAVSDWSDGGASWICPETGEGPTTPFASGSLCVSGQASRVFPLLYSAYWGALLRWNLDQSLTGGCTPGSPAAVDLNGKTISFSIDTPPSSSFYLYLSDGTYNHHYCVDISKKTSMSVPASSFKDDCWAGGIQAPITAEQLRTIKSIFFIAAARQTDDVRFKYCLRSLSIQ